MSDGRFGGREIKIANLDSIMKKGSEASREKNGFQIDEMSNFMVDYGIKIRLATRKERGDEVGKEIISAVLLYGDRGYGEEFIGEYNPHQRSISIDKNYEKSFEWKLKYLLEEIGEITDNDRRMNLFFARLDPENELYSRGLSEL